MACIKFEAELEITLRKHVDIDVADYAHCDNFSDVKSEIRDMLEEEVKDEYSICSWQSLDIEESSVEDWSELEREWNEMHES